MVGLAERLGEDEESWALAGLVHDMDYEDTVDDPERHGLVSAEMLDEHGLSARRSSTPSRPTTST